MYTPTLNTLEPHLYPTWIKLIIFLMIGCFVYAVLLVPKYISAAKNLKEGEQFLAEKQYKNAIVSFEESLKLVPSAKKPKILIAKTYFYDEDKENDENAIMYLENIELNNYDWTELKKVMPEEFQKLFDVTK